jgi:hypothetical protein
VREKNILQDSISSHLCSLIRIDKITFGSGNGNLSTLYEEMYALQYLRSAFASQGYLLAYDRGFLKSKHSGVFAGMR